MDSRERYQRALTFQGPDRPPVIHHSTAGAFRAHGRALEALYAKYPGDILVSPKGGEMFAFADHPRGTGEVGKVSYDDWGVGWLWNTSDYMGQAVEHPLARWEAFDGFRAPDPMTGEEGVRLMQDAARKDGGRRFVYVDGGELWQRMFFLRGYENALVDVLEDRPELYALRDMVADWDIARIRRWSETRVVDAILIRDDWGTQNALMVRPAIWRKLFKPAYKRIVDAIHSGGALAGFHTDGCTRDIIPDLIEAGFDELNPQVHLMDVEELGRSFAGKVAFRPDIDRQQLLPRGTPDEVRAFIRKLFDALGTPKGGFVGWGEANADVPLANIQSMLEAFYGLRQA